MATLTLFLSELLKTLQESQVVHPTAGVPALTFRAGTYLSFVLLTLPASPGSRACSQAPCFSVVCTCSGAPLFSLVAHALPSSQDQSGSSEHSGAPVFSLVTCLIPDSRSQSALSQVPVCESSPLPSVSAYCFLAPEHIDSLPLPFILEYLCADSQLPASYLNIQCWSC